MRALIQQISAQCIRRPSDLDRVDGDVAEGDAEAQQHRTPRQQRGERKHMHAVHQHDQRTLFVKDHICCLKHEIGQQMRRNQRDQKLDREQGDDG